MSHSEQLRNITLEILDETRPAYSCRAEVMELKAIFEDVGSLSFAREISDGETATNAGTAISPMMAAMCLDDFARTVQFIRGVHEAIVDQRRKHAERPVRILYAGCGPWSTLAVPLMSLFTAEEARFTLIDIHAESIRSAERVVRLLELTDRVQAFVIGDAVTFKMDAAAKPDVIVIEMLRAALDAEPQVAVAMNLTGQASRAVLIPEK